MYKKWIVKSSLLVVLAGVVLFALTGCGGQQNPVQFRGDPEPNLIDGIYDGSTIIIGLVGAFYDDQKYGIYDKTSTGRFYDLGYFLGLSLFFAFVTGVAVAFRYPLTSPRGIAVVMIVVILTIILLRRWGAENLSQQGWSRRVGAARPACRQAGLHCPGKPGPLHIFNNHENSPIGEFSYIANLSFPYCFLLIAYCLIVLCATLRCLWLIAVIGVTRR